MTNPVFSKQAVFPRGKMPQNKKTMVMKGFTMSTNLRKALQFQVSEISARIAEIKKANPCLQKSGDFDAYKVRKAEVSLWLTALSLIKRAGDEMPTKGEAAKLFHELGFANHARKGRKAKNLFFKAFRELSKFNNSHKHSNFSRLAGFDKWLKEKEARLAELAAQRKAAEAAEASLEFEAGVKP